MPRPFADAALNLASYGLAVIPCPASDGKSPAGAVSGLGNWKQKPGPKALAKFAERHGDANIGVITSLSNVTVVDVDSATDVANEVERLIGATPLVTRTPSGGSHLWYKSKGERNANLRNRGWPVDVKGIGTGIVIVPPSFRPSTGVPYQIERGSWDELARLPAANLNALVRDGRFAAFAAVQRGQRNNQLFRFALREAPRCDDESALMDVVLTANASMSEPLSEREAIKTAQSAWGIQMAGNNWVGQEARAVIGKSTSQSLIKWDNWPDALAVLVMLRQEHGARNARGESFAISPLALADSRRFGRWSAPRIRNARTTLLEAGLIRCIRKGGRGPRDPSLFILSG